MILRDNVQNERASIHTTRHLSVPKYLIIAYSGTDYCISTS